MAQPKTPKCHQCGASLSGPRTIIKGQWTCPACTYKHDYPEKEIVEVKRPRARRGPPQDETLFPLPPATERR